MTVTFEGLSTTADFSLATSTFDALTAPQKIVAEINQEGTICQAILIPSVAVAGAKVCFMLNNLAQEKFYWDISDKEFAKGKNVSYNISMNQKGVEFLGSTIIGWTIKESGVGFHS